MKSLMPSGKVARVGVFFLFVFATLACTRYAVRRLSGNPPTRTSERHAPVAGVGAVELRLDAPRHDSHRLLLDPAALAHLRESAKLRTDAFMVVLTRADEALSRAAPSGYQGFDWADAVADLALAWHATGDARYADGAVRYLRALLDDRFVVGDGVGGKDVVTHDSGYGIRTFGAYAALGYDWLRDAPGMDSALRAHVLERLGQWLTWYGTDGYLRDRITANYYWGYLTALSFAGLAAAGESPAADGWLRLARDELATRVLPELDDDLQGGGWPEGLQYGEYTTVEIALVARAFRTGAGIDIASRLPWLAETVTYHAHALLPDEQSVYDGGSWGEHPARPSAAGLAAVSVALEGVNDQRADEARWMVGHVLPPLQREQAWVRLLADRPRGKESSPRTAATSLHVKGEGLTFVRSDWSRAAVWASFQAGPRLAEDHQDADQGHFELWRGSDGLLVDGGDSEGSATINHNTLLVDDGGRHLNYPPNQGVWGTKVRTTHFGDDGLVAVAVGDVGEAYAPSCAEDGCTKRSVEKFVRTFAYVRPSLVVVDDRVSLERAEFGVVWAAHVTTPPVISGALASAVVGGSRVDIRTLEPNNAELDALREPTLSGEGSHRSDHPWGPMWRIEVSSARGTVERRFLHFITVDRSGAAPAPSHHVEGDNLRGGVVRIDGRTSAVLFATRDAAGRITLGEGVELVVVAGLTPGSHYDVSVVPSASCKLAISPTENAAAMPATAGGYLRLNTPECRVN